MNRLAAALIVSLSLFTMGCRQNLITYSNTRNITENYTLLNDTTLSLSGVSSDLDFGFSQEKPIMVGIADVHKAAENVEKYLQALLGPDGEKIEYQRLKPCCPFKTKNFVYDAPLLGKELDRKHGMLEKYKVSYQSNSGDHSRILFFNLYDETKNLLAPHGFSYKGK